jgi:malonyl-CoA O-methyltransferase
LKNDINAPEKYAKIAVLAHEVAINMLSRLDFVTLKPTRILDIDCRVGVCTSLLKKRYPDAQIVAMDPSLAMLTHAQKTQEQDFANWMCATAANLPIRSHGFDLIVANLVIPWCSDVKQLLREWHRVLRPEGLLMFTSLGPDTLMELDDHRVSLPHFTDMHDLGDGLIQAGFSDPVLDVEHFTLKYRQWEQLLHELQVTDMIHSLPLKNENQPLSLTYEVIYGQAFGSMLSSEYNSDEDGIVKIPLSHLRKRIS